MSAPELTEAVDVAARAVYAKHDGTIPFDDLPTITQWGVKQQALEWIYPVAQMLFDQGKRAMLTELQDIDAIEQWYFDDE